MIRFIDLECNLCGLMDEYTYNTENECKLVCKCGELLSIENKVYISSPSMFNISSTDKNR